MMDVEHGTHAIVIYVRFRETGDSDIFFDKPLKNRKYSLKETIMKIFNPFLLSLLMAIALFSCGDDYDDT
ncbi:MAG: hypothetical protein LUI85_10140, partial [Bacteroides sp.]|nr:hypothetical protein [Bacteroides sp.]